MKKNKLKKALYVLSLSTLLVNCRGSSDDKLQKQALLDKYNVSYNTVNYLDDNQLLKKGNNSLNSSIIDNINYELDYMMVPQGITLYNDYILVSAYDYLDARNSIILVLNNNGELINKCELDTNAHVGGIAYDNFNNILWVSNIGGTLNGFRINNIINNSSAKSLYRDILLGDDLINYRGSKSISYLTFYNNKLYVGNFVNRGSGKLKEYTLERKGSTITFNNTNIFKVPTYVQGVTFYNSNNNDYILFSRSSGSNVPSLIQIYKFDPNCKSYDENDNKCISYEATNMLEQISINNGKLYSVYENAATPYVLFSNNNGNNEIKINDIDSIIKK